MSSSFQAGHALLIGAGADLPFTIDDARGIAEILKDPDRCAYPPGQVELLVGEAAHRQAVLDALDRLAGKADESSTIIIYFSGHGYRASTPIGEAYFLIPFGVQIERLKDTTISGSEFASRLQSIRSKKLLLLLDCCHAGGLGLAKGLELAKSPLPPEMLQILKQGKGRVIIASCKESELSYGGRPYSAFTLALIEAFSGLGASKQDGFVRAADLAMHAREISIACEIGDKRNEGIWLGVLGFAFEKLGKLEEAIQYTKAALGIFEQIESPYADQARKKLAQWQGDDPHK